MRKATALMFPILSAPLAGQAAMAVRLVPVGPSAPANLSEWEAKVRRDGWSQWVLLSGPGKDWTSDLEQILDTDPDLMEFGIGQWVVPQSSTLGKELSAREHWGSEARWALVDKHGAVLESGTTLPTKETLKALVERWGIQGPIQVLSSFLASHPDRVDALDTLLTRRVYLARRLMRPYLKPVKPLPANEFPTAPPDPPRLSRSLPDEMDEKIWGPVARLLGVAQRDQVVRYLDGAGTLILFSSGAALSPVMQGAASRSLPQIEEALRTQPDSYTLWDLWVRLQEIAGGRPLRPLLDSITPLPLPNAKVMPTDISLGIYISGAKRAGHWRDIVDLVQPWWNDQKETHRRVFTLDQDGKPGDALKGDWDRLIAPLVEAYLRLGRAFDADRVVRETMAWRPSPGLPRWASEVARQCGDEASAAQWARMTVPETGSQ